jgi:bis(5'-nucleosyl)-tetraphosphatase (symmetrical)
MTTYAIGDVQGCYDSLQALLKKIHFNRARDTLWFTGDLVNRGPQSAETLRFVRSMNEHAVVVLGNHDLHALARAAGKAPPKRGDTIDDLLTAPDRDDLLDWLRRRPLLHHDAALGFTLVHAGLLPPWDLDTALALAQEAEAVLKDDDAAPDFFSHMYGDQPDCWDEKLSGWPRLRVIINAFTRLRYCDAQGRVDLAHLGSPGTQPPHLLPWFQVPGRFNRNLRVIFGHWSTLGIWNQDGVIGLDSGCLWGGALTGVKLEGGAREFFSVPCPRTKTPG